MSEKEISAAEQMNGAVQGRLDMREFQRLLANHIVVLVLVPLVLGIATAGWTLVMPNIYRGEILLAPPSVEEQREFGLSRLPGLESIASLAGIALPSGGNNEVNLAVLRSREFIWRFIDDNNLMPILFEREWDAANGRWRETDPKEQPTRWDAYRLFMDDILSVTADQQTGLVRVAVEWNDPELASRWANEIVTLLNQYLRSRAIERSESNMSYLQEAVENASIADIREALYELIENEQRTAMLVNTQKDFAFRIIDPSVVPDRKV